MHRFNAYYRPIINCKQVLQCRNNPGIETLKNMQQVSIGLTHTERTYVSAILAYVWSEIAIACSGCRRSCDRKVVAAVATSRCPSVCLGVSVCVSAAAHRRRLVASGCRLVCCRRFNRKVSAKAWSWPIGKAEIHIYPSCFCSAMRRVFSHR